ncbi:ABC transporter permease [Ketobacter sp. MCCC 1A13808]|nr:ABC transporter permease [Ketobacter sp. MCCC 1A13808]MVF14295.1 ABC transporter permease [Ketobacter sp. MCCC 1A13808]
MTAKAQQVSIKQVHDDAAAACAAAGNKVPVPEAIPRSPINADVMGWFQDKGLSWVVRILAIIGAIGVWQLASSFQWSFFLSFENVPTPVVVFDALLAQLNNAEFYKHIMVSLQRILLSYLLAVVIGVLIGVLMGMYKIAEDIFLPYIEILRPIPAVAWIPMAILVMPTEESSIIFITFLGALFPIILNTVHGVEQTPVNLIRAAKSFGANGRNILWHVVLPGALPSILAGLAIGMGVAWFSLLAGEIISGQYGIGYFTWSAYTLVEYPNIIIGMLIIGLLGTGSTALVRLMAKPMLRWQGEKGGNR